MSYLSQLNHYLEEANNACRSITYKANVAHLYGVAAEFRYDCLYNSDYDGEDFHGQELAMKLEDVCLKVLNGQTVMEVEKEVTAKAKDLAAWLKKVKA